MLVLRSTRLLAAVLGVALMTACTTPQQNGEQQQGQGVNKTVTYGAIGALGGAVLGAATSSKKDRGKGAVIGAAVGGAAGAGYGYYVDKQEEALRAQMQGSGVGVNRQGDVLQVVMPDVTFATNSANIASDFYTPLNRLAANLNEYEQSRIHVSGHTDSTGSVETNRKLSMQRAFNVSKYLINQGVAPERVTASGMGADNPVASNATAAGRAQNRRVEVTLTPIGN